jgi:membrane-associated HD superfamily phosphohydrolase
MLEFASFVVAIFTAYIAYLQLKKTVPERPGRRSSSKTQIVGIPSISFLLRSIFTKYPRSIFLFPLALFAGLKIPDVAIYGSILAVAIGCFMQTRSKRLDVAIGGIFFISFVCIGVWFREIELVREIFREVRIF